MSQRAKRNQRIALQIGLLSGLLLLTGCATVVPKGVAGNSAVYPTTGAAAKTLKHARSIDHVILGGDDTFARLIFGGDVQDLGRPVAVALRGNFMYIADADLGLIFQYDLTLNHMLPIRGAGDEILGEASDLYVAKDFSFYATDTVGKRVFHFSPTGELLKVFENGPNISHPISIAFDENKQELYVADEVFSHIVDFSADGEPQFGIGGRGDGPGKFRIITDMIKTSSGYIVSDRIELAVQILDNDGNYVSDFGQKELVFPTAIAQDKYGRIFVSDKADSRIKVFKDGKMIDVVGRNGYAPGEFRYISDMKIHEDKLYVVDSLNGRIQVFDILPDTKVSLLQ